jgi:hypothetical protein
MSNTPNLVFFNKKGYPYNFTLNDGIWNGKIFFDPSSTDIFKSLTMYTLEKVDPILYTNNFDIINTEIYNTSGMTLSSGGYDNLSVTNILSVNQDPNFYTKWVYGNKFNKYFPVGTIVSFSGYTGTTTTTGESDFSSDYIFTVLRTVKNAIMIGTSTSNDNYSFIYDSDVNDFKLNSHDCISIPDPNQSLTSTFNVDINERLSVIGTQDGNNDGVYELLNTGYTDSSIFDFDLSGLTTKGDYINVDLTMFTERPLLYNGQISIDYISSTLYSTFVDGKNSNISIGTKFICEDDNWNHLLSGNEYEVQSIITEELICTTGVTFFEEIYEEDDGQIEKLYYVRIDQSFDIEEDWDIRFNSITNQKNNNLTRRVVDIKSGSTVVDNIDYIYYDFYLDGYTTPLVDVQYSLTRVLKSHEQNTVVVTSSIDNSTYNGQAKVMSITNKVRYSQEVSVDGVNDAIDSFILKNTYIFQSNGIDIYRKNSTLFFDGRYSGQYTYFDVDLFINSTPVSIDGDYSDLSGNTSYYHLILDDNDITYERLNMSNDLSRSYYADITLDLFDDSQDFGFELTVNTVQYYIPFNDNSGTTSYTLETIKSFIDKYGDSFFYNGIDIYSGTTTSGSTTINHLYLSGHEPNVDVYGTKVKVNRNSSYTIDETVNSFMMITANKLNSYTNLSNIGFSTGMVISVSGSTYPLNNKEFNIIGIDSDTIELSYQGPMYSESNVSVSIKSREYLRRPRESNDVDISYRFRWEDDLDKSVFLYDLSGENLVPWGDNNDYKYIGPEPLTSNNDLVFLNKEPNKDRNSITIPYKQQTVFDQLDFDLEKFDDDNISILPKPIETFIGYNTKDENVNQRNLIIERVDNIMYSGYADGTNLYFTVSDNNIVLTTTGNESFLELGFKSNRYLRMKFDDKKTYTQSIFEDYQDFLITDVTNTKLVVDATLSDFTTISENYYFEFDLLPERMAFIRLFGETESEDERFEANLKLLGVSITEEDEYIFKQSDLTEDGIDYRLLNRKRKEMLNIFPDIYNYIGSYRGILNSIDFFGYNDVELVEYYRNIDKDSPYFDKLKRVIIPDLNDREVEGWTYSEVIPNPVEYIKTNLFNLTYKITDEEGNNVLLYTLKDVQVKLNGLKKWLRRNVVPVDSNIKDITGVSECVGTEWRRFDSTNNFTKNNINQSNDAVNINYTATRNFNDSWLVSVRFYTVTDIVPESWDLKVITFKKDPETGKLYPQQRWDVLKTDMDNFNFSINWDNDYEYDRFFYVQTTNYNHYGVAKQINKMYKLDDGETYYFDEFKNYTLINNNFRYKTFPYVQNIENVYIMDGDGNFWIINKEDQANRIS